MTQAVSSSTRRFAAYEQTLVQVEHAILILLRRKAGKGTQYFIGSAVPDEEGDVAYYLTVSILPRYAKEYFRGRCDLRYLYVYAPSATYYRIEPSEAFSERAELKEIVGTIDNNLIPSKGFFSRYHNTSPYLQEGRPPSVKEIKLDGEWRMEELREMYSRYADLYAFAEAVDEIRGKPRENIRQRYVRAFHSKPFKGGSSYLGFFSDLRSALPAAERPGLEGVRWESPGRMRIRGTDQLFDDVDDMIQHFMGSADAAREAHRDLRERLRSLKLLEITASKYFATPQQLAEIARLTRRLMECLAVPGNMEVLKVLDGNAIVGAKIALAVFRRVSATAEYFMEGRAVTPPAASSLSTPG